MRMMSMLRQNGIRTVLACSCAFIAVSAVNAAPVTHFSASSSYIDFEATEQSYLPNGAATSGSASSQANFSGAEGVAQNYGNADLGTGKLAASNNFHPADGKALSSEVAASFGDSFRASSGSTAYSPFTWSSSDVANFTFDLSGTYASFGTQTFGIFSVSILKPGTLDALANFLGTGASLSPSFFADNEIHSAVYTLGDPGLLTDPNISTFPATISTSFNPNGDFDWAMTLDLFSVVSGDQPAGAFADYDFAHTIQASYQGPQGSTTFSASGAFPGTKAPGSVSAVPEPASWAMMIAGFGLVGGAMRHRRPQQAVIA